MNVNSQPYTFSVNMVSDEFCDSHVIGKRVENEINATQSQLSKVEQSGFAAASDLDE